MTGHGEAPAADGVVYWLTGLAGAGKTTIAREMTALLRAEGRPVVHLDGDQLRWALGSTRSYSADDRKQLALTYSRLCSLLSGQGIDVVCSTISMFAEVHGFNRNTLPRYVEVYIRVPLDILEKRDQKGLYSGARRGEISNVIGIDLPLIEPSDPDMIVDNDGSDTPPTLAMAILSSGLWHTNGTK